MDDVIELISPNFSDVLQPNMEMKKFPDGDSYIRIPQIRECSDKNVILFHRLYPDQDGSLMQALFMLEALREVRANVTLVAPYLPYTRQDKIFLKGEVKSADMICRLLSQAGCTQLLTIDCHFLKKPGKFDYAGLRIYNISMNEKLIQHAKKQFNEEPFEMISPDQGAKYMVESQGGMAMEKKRGRYEEGEQAYRGIETLESSFDFDEKNVLIIDDMISTGSTMMKAVENVKDSGAKKIACAATHGFFLRDSLAHLRRQCDFVFVTNSIPSPVAEINVLRDLKGQLEML